MTDIKFVAMNGISASVLGMVNTDLDKLESVISITVGIRNINKTTVFNKSGKKVEWWESSLQAMCDSAYDTLHKRIRQIQVESYDE